ncbi:MAG: DUF1080 domain-containing protein [Armatimonadetes bacterium]|nr:DUF1080 domain-containing protein [Armatimonadota bacterium]
MLRKILGVLVVGGAMVLAGSCVAVVVVPAAPVALNLPTEPPPGAVVLLAGKAEDMHKSFYTRGSRSPCGWKVDADGVAAPDGNDITSVAEFGDCFLHAEFWCPADAAGNAIGHGNSGIGFMGRYEVQIMNSFGHAAAADQCAAFYSQKAPKLIASRKPGEWQTYDIIFRAPRFDADGKLTERARATVIQNGLIVQNNEEFLGPTGIQYGDFHGEVATGPIVIQGNHDPVKYRNIWLVAM